MVAAFLRPRCPTDWTRRVPFAHTACLTQPLRLVLGVVSCFTWARLAATSAARWKRTCGTPCASLCVTRQGAATVDTFSLAVLTIPVGFLFGMVWHGISKKRNLSYVHPFHPHLSGLHCPLPSRPCAPATWATGTALTSGNHTISFTCIFWHPASDLVYANRGRGRHHGNGPLVPSSPYVCDNPLSSRPAINNFTTPILRPSTAYNQTIPSKIVVVVYIVVDILLLIYCCCCRCCCSSSCCCSCYDCCSCCCFSCSCCFRRLSRLRCT